jgi:hypothetical protein
MITDDFIRKNGRFEGPNLNVVLTKWEFPWIDKHFLTRLS